MNGIPSRWVDFYYNEMRAAVENRIKNTSIIIATEIVYPQQKFMVFEYDTAENVPKCTVKGIGSNYYLLKKANEAKATVIHNNDFIMTWFNRMQCNKAIPEGLYPYFAEIIANIPSIIESIEKKANN